MTDARFRDADDRPLALRALDVQDLAVVSAMVQDGVFPVTEMRWQKRQRRLAILLNRFRWEDRAAAEAAGRPVERVQAVLSVEDVTAVQVQGLDPADRDVVASVLAVEFAPGEDGRGRVTLLLAGDGAIAADVECLEVTLRDVTRPYLAPSRKAPSHRLD